MFDFKIGFLAKFFVIGGIRDFIYIYIYMYLSNSHWFDESCSRTRIKTSSVCVIVGAVGRASSGVTTDRPTDLLCTFVSCVMLSNVFTARRDLWCKPVGWFV